MVTNTSKNKNQRRAAIVEYFHHLKCFLPVSPVIAVELSQSELLQFDLQLLVLPLQVHNHAVQEVDLMETIRTQMRPEDPEQEQTDRKYFGRRPDSLTCPSANSFSSLSCSRAASPAEVNQKEQVDEESSRTECMLIMLIIIVIVISSPEGGASTSSPPATCVPMSLCSRLWTRLCS